MKTKKKDKILFVISFIPLIITSVSLCFMSDKVPAHYNVYGNIDRWGSKYEYLIFPLIIIGLYLFFIIYIKFYAFSNTEEVEKANQNIKVLYIVAVLVIFALDILSCIFLILALMANSNTTRFEFDFNVVLNCIFSVVFIVLGNYLPKSKRNSTIGVATPLSLKSEKAWYISNRSGGIAFVVTGFITIAESFVIGGFLSTIIMIGILIFSLIISTVYSYIVIKRDKNAAKQEK